MPTINELCELAFSYVSKDLFETVTASQKLSLAAALNGAQQEIYGRRPELFRAHDGITLEAPRSVSITVTQGNKQVSIQETGGTYSGRSLRISGETEMHEIAIGSPETAGGGATTCTLVRPFAGPSGTVSATLYHDAIPLSSSHVIGNVELMGYGPLSPAGDRQAFRAFRDTISVGDYGLERSRNILAHRPDQPVAWWVETGRQLGTPTSTPIVLRIAPIPDRAYVLTFDTAVTPLRIVGGNVDSPTYDSLSIPMPADAAESILLPLFLQRWSASPWWKNEVARAEIGRQYKAAILLLDGFAAQSETAGYLFVGCS